MSSFLPRYFYESNTAVDGCCVITQPGYEHMEWLRVQLNMIRKRGMKAIIIGHVPPARAGSKNNWDETCWQKYTLWLHQYRDVIVGSVYGHMNVDHFMLQNFRDIDIDVAAGLVEPERSSSTKFDDDITIESAGEYLVNLRDDWAELPRPPNVDEGSSDRSQGSTGHSNSYFDRLLDLFRNRDNTRAKKNKRRKYLDAIGGTWAEHFSVSHVSPSVVPNYFPTLRVFEYNITGLQPPVLHNRLEYQPRTDRSQAPLLGPGDLRAERHSFIADESVGYDNVDAKKDKNCKGPKCDIPEPPSNSSPPGPAYSPQTFTFLSYTQYFANLTYINNDFQQDGSLTDAASDDSDAVANGKWKEGKYRGKRPKKGTKPHPRKFEFQVEYNTSDDKLYGLEDLTVRSYLDLAGQDREVRIGGTRGGLGR